VKDHVLAFRVICVDHLADEMIYGIAEFGIMFGSDNSKTVDVDAMELV
jgi:hypothetical protein